MVVVVRRVVTKECKGKWRGEYKKERCKISEITAMVVGVVLWKNAKS